MTDSAALHPLALLSDQLAGLVDGAARGIVAVHGGRRWSTSGIHWRPGVIVTAEESLERDEDITVSLPDGRRVAASLAGRDPSTDVAVLRFQPDGLPVANTGDAAALRPGHLVLAVGRHEDGTVVSQGIVGFAGGAWQSRHGGTIDHRFRLDLALSPSGEGGALVDVSGHVLGMTVPGPWRRVIAIPTSTIDRAVDQLLAKGHVARGYLGAGLQRVRRGLKREDGATTGRGLLVASLDSDGPAARAGLLIGDVITAWNGTPTTRVREAMRLLGTDSVGTIADLALIRGGAPASVKVTIGERPLA